MTTHRFRRKRNENDIIKACLTWLHLHGFWAIRINSGAFKTERGGFYRMSVPGMSDIVALKNGVCYFIETKMPGKNQNANQIKFEQDIRRAGGVYFVVHDIAELEERLNG